jgi:hypothetical protein
MSAVKTAEFVSDTMSHTVLRGCWCNIVLNVHAPSKEKRDNSKDSFYEELDQDFDHFPKYHTNILVGDFIQNWGERIYSNPQLGMTVYFR